MTFLQVMRHLYRSRKAGVSLQAAMLALDDADWDVIWHRLMEAARLDRALLKYRAKHGRSIR